MRDLGQRRGDCEPKVLGDNIRERISLLSLGSQWLTDWKAACLSHPASFPRLLQHKSPNWVPGKTKQNPHCHRSCVYGQRLGGGWEECGPSSATKLALVSCFSLGYGMLAEQSFPILPFSPPQDYSCPGVGSGGMSLEGTQSCTAPPPPHTRRGRCARLRSYPRQSKQMGFNSHGIQFALEFYLRAFPKIITLWADSHRGRGAAGRNAEPSRQIPGAP